MFSSAQLTKQTLDLCAQLPRNVWIPDAEVGLLPGVGADVVEPVSGLLAATQGLGQTVRPASILMIDLPR